MNPNSFMFKHHVKVNFASDVPCTVRNILNSYAYEKSDHLVATHATPQLRDDIYRRYHTLGLQVASSHQHQHTAYYPVLNHKEKQS